MFPILTAYVPGSLDTESLKSETAELYVKNKSKPTIFVAVCVILPMDAMKPMKSMEPNWPILNSYLHFSLN